MAGPSRELFRVGGNAIGTFRCRPFDPEFPRGWIEGPHLVFPRTSVMITQEGHQPFPTDSNVMVIYRGQQEYSRQAIDPAGDMCEWFEIDPAWVEEAARGHDPESDGSWIGRTYAFVSPDVYLMQRWLTRFVSIEPDPDPVLVEEVLLRILEGATGAAHQSTSRHSSTRSEAQHQEIVMNAQAYLGTNFMQRLTIADIGNTVGASPYHLARLFRALTGWSIHQYLTNLRLRAALGYLEDTSVTVADVALAVGFADHSHLTKAFRERFGVTPSRFRRSGADLLSTILIA